jgi:hypothetical protein
MNAVKGWGMRDIPAARHLWAQIRLVTGGSVEAACTPGPGSCRSAYMKICTAGGGDMDCPCLHWFNLTPRQRAMLVAWRAGMPVGLIALMAGDDDPQAVARQIDVLVAMAEVDPLKIQAERITARVPMWRERRITLKEPIHADCG